MTELRLILIITGTILLLGIYYWGRRSRKTEAEQEYVRGEEDWLEKLAEQRKEENIPYVTPVLDEEGNPQRMVPSIGELELEAEPSDSVIQRARSNEQLDEPALFTDEVSSGGDAVISATRAKPASKAEDPLFLEEYAPQPATPVVTAKPAALDEPIGEELIIVLNVMAHEGSRFPGLDIHTAMAMAGMHHGDMNIYHQHVETNGSGPTIFSIANVIEPGSFDPASMEEFSSPGLVLFLRLPVAIESGKAFEKMLASARLLAQQLDGELMDETRSTLTQQTIGHLRERVAAYQFKQQLAQSKD